MTITLTEAISDFIEQRKEIKLKPYKKALQKALDDGESELEIAEAKVAYEKAAQPIEEKFKPEAWLTDAAKRAKRITPATHAPKYTHSDTKGSCVLDANIESDEAEYLVTSVLAAPVIDSVCDAAVLDVDALLKVTCNDQSLIDQLGQGHLNALDSFTQVPETMESWVKGFKLALGDDYLRSHNLSKQIYFPIDMSKGNSSSYHLICPLFASSIAHKLHGRVTSTRYGDSKDIRDARRKEHYHPELDESFLNTAIQNFGGSKPQNISQLNNERYGQSFLLNCAPPTWQSQTKPPLHLQSLFSRPLNFKTSNLIREFKLFLTNLKDHDKSFKKRYKRDYSFVLPIIDVVFDYAVKLQALTDFSGWTDNNECQMKVAHALWVDIANPREAFQQERDKDDWMAIVAHDFASWLKNRLKNDKYRMTDIEHAYFEKVFMERLKRFEQTATKIGVQ